MKALLVEEKSSLANLQIEEVPMPKIESHEILVKVKACGINPVDWKGINMNLFQTPYIVGSDISGIVENVGTEVTHYKIGDEVIGSLEWGKQGAFAEYVATQEKYLALKPKNLTFEESAALPLTALTAWQGLFDKLELQAGQKILIQAAAGGVGLFAVQFAKWKGAYVVAVASEKNVGFLKSFGADEVLNYKSIDFSKMAKDFDAVFDSVASAEQTMKIIKKGGKYVSLTASPPDNLANSYGITATSLLFQSNALQLKEIVNLVEQEKVKVSLDKTFPFLDAVKAMEYQKLGHTKGKNVLTVK